MPNTLMSHALAMVETTLAGPKTSVSLGVQAEPRDIPFAWPGGPGATYGFALGPDTQWQPTSFSPILGYDGSHLNAGETRTVNFRVLLVPGDWKQALEYSSEHIDKVTDYRKP